MEIKSEDSIYFQIPRAGRNSLTADTVVWYEFLCQVVIL